MKPPLDILNDINSRIDAYNQQIHLAQVKIDRITKYQDNLRSKIVELESQFNTTWSELCKNKTESINNEIRELETSIHDLKHGYHSISDEPNVKMMIQIYKDRIKKLKNELIFQMKGE
jgi:chromosome segregation ATPase